MEKKNRWKDIVGRLQKKGGSFRAFQKFHGLSAVLPAVCLGIFIAAVLMGYQEPRVSKYQASAAEIDQIKEALSSESSSTSSAKASKTSGKKGSFDLKDGEYTGSAPTVSKVSEDGSWKDGTYTGSAKGFGGNISVKVTVKDGKITKIQVTSAPGEGSSYLSKAKSLIASMISGQTTNVDAASGATYSSNGLINAVRNALAKAKTDQTTESEKKTTKKKTTVKPDPGAQVPYDNGTYTGSGEGFGGTTKVSVTIKSHKITSISVISAEDDEPFLTNAKGLISTMIRKQSADVDVVSGATYSSKGIIEAVKNALKEAEKATKNHASKKKKTESTTQKKTESKKETEGTTEPDTKDDTAGASTVYNDGTYTVTVTCHADENEDFEDYEMTAAITIARDKITAISIVSISDTSNQSYVNRVKNQMVPKIISKGKADGVDGVSRATCTSTAVKDACNAAFSAAKK